MDYATEATVLGDFDDAEFTHVAFDDLLKLSEEDLRLATETVAPDVWAMALKDSPKELEERVLKLMDPAAADACTAQMQWLAVVRPCDVADAQRAIGDALRKLKREGRVDVDFAVTSKFFRRGGKFFVRTDNRDGRMETFEVKYVFGVHPLQQYLVEFDDGRVQCLPIAWDTKKEQWFHLYPKEPIPHDDPLHWTRPLQNWNYMCAECHTTNLKKNYSIEDNAYHTTWSEIDVSCETCHGPGSLHVRIARGDGKFGFWDRRYGYGLADLNDKNPRVQIETCAPCHARRRIVYPQHHFGGKLLDHYLPELLDGDLYYPDGQILEEDYVYGSFIQSKMYDKQVRCSDCHDPHTTRVKFNDNRLCCQCHERGKYDTQAPHHHPDASRPGTKCVECHMPQTKYMVVDPRRDHSLRVPRPDLTVSLKIPNACNLCHHDPHKGETAEWAARQCRTWYGEPKEIGKAHFAYGIAAARRFAPEGEQKLVDVTRQKDQRAMIRASAIALLSHYRGGSAEAAAVAGLEDREELVRAASVRSLQRLPWPQLHRRLAPMLHDPVRAVRTEAARLLTRVPRRSFAQQDLRAFQQALDEYLAGQKAVADQAAAHLNIGVVYANLGQYHYGDGTRLDPQYAAKAEAEYRTAIRLDPLFVPARINLAMLCDQQDRKHEAEALFREILRIEPDLGEVYYSLGLLLAENDDRMEEAAEMLGHAARLGPDNPRIHYNYGLALQKLGRTDEAADALKTAIRISGGDSPQSTQFIHALAILYAQQEDWPRALACVEQLIHIEPENRQWPRLLESLRQASRKPPAEESPQPGS